VDAVVVVIAAEAGEQLLGRAVGLAVAVLVLEDKDVGRLADEHLPARTDGVLGHGDAHRAVKVGRLVEGGRLVRLARALGVFEDDDAITLGAVERLVVHLGAVVDRLAHPDAAEVVDVHARRVDEVRLGGPELEFEAVTNGERRFALLRRHLGARHCGNSEEDGGGKRPAGHGAAGSLWGK
jgi:hypothetical protein